MLCKKNIPSSNEFGIIGQSKHDCDFEMHILIFTRVTNPKLEKDDLLDILIILFNSILIGLPVRLYIACMCYHNLPSSSVCAPSFLCVVLYL